MRRLVIRPGAIGDFIVSLPALESLKTDYLEVWTRSPNVPLVRFADRVRPIAFTGLDLLGVTDTPPRLIDELRGFDSIVSWYGANRPDFRECVRALRLPFTFFPALPPEAAGIHAVDFYLEQTLSIEGVRRPEPGAVPHITCDAPREDFAVMHPFSGSPRKNWPLRKFAAIARGLERSMEVRWCAGREDPPLEALLTDLNGHPPPRLVRIDDLYDLACCLARARLYVGNDSGITHLAAAVGTPVLALFGPTNPAVWAPRGPNVRVALWRPA